MNVLHRGAQKFRQGLIGYFERSLVRKLILSYILVFAIPSVLFGFYAFDGIRATYEENEIQSSLQSLQREKESILKNMEVCERAAQIFLSKKEFFDFVNNKRDYTAEELIALKNNVLVDILHIQDANPDIFRMRFFCDNPFIDRILNVLYNESLIRGTDWAQKAIEKRGRVYWRLTHPDELHPENMAPTPFVVSLYREVRYPVKAHLGVLEVNMRAEDFFKEMYNSGTDRNDFMFVTKGDGELLYNKNNEFVRSLGLDDGQIREMAAGRVVNEEGTFAARVNNRSIMVAYSHVKPLDAVLYKAYSTENVSRKIDFMRNIIIAGVIVLILVLSLVTFVITSVLLKKMNRIITAVRKVQEGDLAIEIPAMGKDEIGELARHFKKMMSKINDLVFMVASKQAAAKEAEIRALQSQINKHFLYNVLESIKMMAHIKGEHEISSTVTSLGRLMRYSMTWTAQHARLGDEIEQVRNYIHLINVRYDNETRLLIDVPGELMDCEVLKMSLQPVVENSINHGLEPKGHAGTISLSARKEEDRLVVRIEDDGAGMPQQRLEEVRSSIAVDPGRKTEAEGAAALNPRGNGIGLRNVNERIKLFCGKDFGMEIDSGEGLFTRVILTFPCKKEMTGGSKHEKSAAGG